LAVDREKTVCGFFKERFYFWMWSSLTPAPDIKRIPDPRLIEAIEYVTADDKKLTGYKYLAHNALGEETKAKGYVLMALGNAMIADQIIGDMRPFSRSGFDVYIYDYRGYGHSEGKRRIHAIIEDYKEITNALNQRYPQKYLYGISIGGAVLLNVIGSGVDYDAAVIDSSPSRLSDHGCPKAIDPLENLPPHSDKLLVITGKQDRVLSESMTGALREEAAKRGAITVAGKNYAHPFMDADYNIHRERLARVLRHFTSENPGKNATHSP